MGGPPPSLTRKATFRPSFAQENPDASASRTAGVERDEFPGPPTESPVTEGSIMPDRRLQPAPVKPQPPPVELVAETHAKSTLSPDVEPPGPPISTVGHGSVPDPELGAIASAEGGLPRTAVSRRSPGESASPSIENGLTRATLGRGRKKAKFISAEAATVQIQTDEDGRLPELVLEEGGKDEPVEEEKTASNPILLIVVLLFSFASSIGMLLISSQAGSGDTPTKAAARAAIEESYIRDKLADEPYQLLLRRAIQAHSRGDFAVEQVLYRRVLDMLHAEGKNEYTGLTGTPVGDDGPSDPHLEKQLNALLGQ